MDIFNNRIAELETMIIRHKQLYYLGQSEISDGEYDKLEDELKLLAPQSQILSKVGYGITGGEKIRHTVLMLSLEKTRTLTGIIEWQAQSQILASFKMDGSSCSIIYEIGQFVLAKTRGDGEFGENITKGFSEISFTRDIAKSDLPLNSEIRGEVCISRANFELLSNEMERRGLEKPKSVRNVVAGLLRRKDDLDLCSFLDFIAYEIISTDNSEFVQSEQHKIELLRSAGFKTPEIRLLHTTSEIENFIEYYKNNKDDYPYLTDGLVLAVDNIVEQKERGYTNHHPKGKLAFKLQADSAVTMVKDIEIAVKRTGKVSFIGIIEPVELSEATISRITLHNMNYIKDNRINIGAIIEIVRSNEVIPKHQKTLQTNGEYQFPTVCPECKSILMVSETATDLLCANESCPSRNFYRILHWINTVNIEDLSQKTLEKLYDDGVVRTVPDLYRIKVSYFLTMDGFKEKLAAKLAANIAKRKELDFTLFLTAVSISGMGYSIARLITEVYPDLDALSAITKTDLLQIKGIGEVLADNLLSARETLGQMITELKSVGVEIIPAKKNDKSDLIWFGKVFVITGTLARPRKEIVAYIEKMGGKVTDAVSANTNFLVANEISNSSKFKKASELKIPVISEEKLFTGDLDE